MIVQIQGTRIAPSAKQRLFIDKVKEGANILIDTCVGSEKTMAIQHLYNELLSDKKIICLMYNKLLKLDARSKIENRDAMVMIIMASHTWF